MPDRASVRAALGKIKRYADYEYFFDHLDAPDWIEPLAAEGLFKEPPEPIREGDLVSFPGWAESRYLKRMAVHAPDKVLAAILGIPQTDNPRVQEDLVDAALAMPPKLGAQLVDKVQEWARSPYQLLLPEKLGQFVKHLASGGYAQQALRIARELLSVQPDPRHIKGKSEKVPFLPHPTGRFQELEYSQILEKYMPALVEAAGENTLELLIELLDEALTLSRLNSQSETDYEDYSYVWRPAIEDHEQNRAGDVRDHLVSALRDTAEFVIRSNPSRLGSIVDRFDQRRWKVFKRISLHLLRTFVAEQAELVKRHLLDPELAEDVHAFHEFWLLAREAFPGLSREDRSAFMAQLQRRLEKDLAEARDLPDESKAREEAQFARSWLYRRLTILRDVLPENWREEYEHLRAEIGDLPNPEFLAYASPAVWHGPTSPKSSEELMSLPVENLVDYLRQWQPSGKPMQDSQEGLGRSLAAAVAADPVRYAANAERFVGLDPTYVRGLIMGLREALKEKREFAWEPVLLLSRWVLSQPREIEGRNSEYHDLDPGWVWTRKAIADLLYAGCDPGPSSLPYTLRREVWAVLLPLTEDADPDPEHEAQYGGSNMDPVTLSINTTRGEAMHAAVRYGLWVRRYFEETESQRDQLTLGFEAIPELRDVLEKHLRPASDPSLAIRAVYGQWFAWLHLLDSRWTTEQVPHIFPRDPALLPFRIAAWDAYIIFGGVYNNIFDPLKLEYAAAIDRLSVDGRSERSSGNPEARLGEHLMVYYWQGKIELGPSDSLLTQFFSRASAKLRGHALDFVGRSLKQDERDVPVATLQRLKALWEWRLDGTEQLSVEDQKEELGAFGWWFASGKFSNDWSIGHLIQLLRRTRKVNVGHMVVERLGSVAKEFPRESIRVLRLMGEGDDAIWWLREAEGVVKAALEGDDNQAREAAVNFIHYLGAKGIDSLEHLLPGSERG